MAGAEIHDLAAAYAVNALDPEDRWTYERHLDSCERCTEEVAALREGATELAYATEGPAPSPDLRERILAAARAERPTAATKRPPRRRLFPSTAAVAAPPTVAAVALGLWANSLRGPEQRVLPMEGGPGRLLISGDEASIVTCVDPAPSGRTYEAWVIENDVPRPAGLFRGGCTTVELNRPVEDGATVAVTLERAGGVETPQGEILMSANV
jgi:anti-sigma-K factor RskA